MVCNQGSRLKCHCKWKYVVLHQLDGYFGIKDEKFSNWKDGKEFLLSWRYLKYNFDSFTVSKLVLQESTEDNPQRSEAPETLQRDVNQQPCVLQTAHLMKQENHPLRGGCVNVVYPSITSDPDTQKRVLGVCCICLDRAADTLTLPCKHRTMCAKCFTAKTITVCPIDRQPIQDCLKIV